MSTERDGNWMDKFGACKVCDGEIPHGHSNNCDLFKIEQERDQLAARVAELELHAKNLIKDDSPYPLDETANILVQAAQTLLEEKNYDGLIHERIAVARNFATLIPSAVDLMRGVLSSSTSSALARLQELERKAKALDWLEDKAQDYTVSFCYFSSGRIDVVIKNPDNGTLLACHSMPSLLSAIESAMEKQG